MVRCGGSLYGPSPGLTLEEEGGWLNSPEEGYRRLNDRAATCEGEGRGHEVEEQGYITYWIRTRVSGFK